GAFPTTIEVATAEDNGRLVMADLDADGRPDLAVLGPGIVSIHRGNGDGTFGPACYSGGLTTFSSIVAADFDGDGKADVAAPQTYSQAITVLFNNGDGTLGSRTDLATIGVPAAVATADFNADGIPDIAVVSGAGQTNE